jgi:hypothetical protein
MVFQSQAATYPLTVGNSGGGALHRPLLLEILEEAFDPNQLPK